MILKKIWYIIKKTYIILFLILFFNKISIFKTIIILFDFVIFLDLANFIKNKILLIKKII